MGVKISVITVCFNAADVLPATIGSVLAQNCSDYEYIIKDGGSTDDTENIIKGCREEFEQKGINFVYESGSDGGIYDAMNMAVSLAKGDLINFMNAGDCFYDEDVLKKVSLAVENMPTDKIVAYGDCAVYEYGRFYRFAKAPEKIGQVMPFSHQTVFASRSLLAGHPFDTRYRYSADYDFLLTAKDEGAEFVDAKAIVAITTADGTSSINYHDTLMETAGIQKKHGTFSSSEEELNKTEKILSLKQFVLDHFPVCIKKMIRSYQISSRGQKIDVTVPPWFKKEDC